MKVWKPSGQLWFFYEIKAVRKNMPNMQFVKKKFSISVQGGDIKIAF